MPARPRAARAALVALVTSTVAVSSAPRSAHADPPEGDCPRVTAPADPVCRPWTGMLLPTVFAGVIAPRGDLGTWSGGGVEVVLPAWSDNSPAYGPSQGKLRFDLGLYRSSKDGLGLITSYRGGAQVSFERNASRSWLIPYFAVDLGGLWRDGHHGFVDGGAGLYLLHRRSAILDLEVTYQLPFSDGDDLSGLRARLAASFALW